MLDVIPNPLLCSGETWVTHAGEAVKPIPNNARRA
jgi:hypothetical protein